MTLPNIPPPRTDDFREIEKWYQNVTRFYNDPALKIGAGSILGSMIEDGAIDQVKMATGIRAIDIVGSLPTLPNASYPSNGSIVFLTTDGKLYRNVSNTWVKTVVAADIVTSSLSAISADMGTLTAGTIQQSYTAPGDNNTTAGAGLKITAGKIEAYGGDQTFGGTIMSSDGNYMVVIGKVLTATGLGKRYPLNNGTNFTADGKTHVYAWRSSAWVLMVTLGNSSLGGSTEVASITHTGGNESGLFVHGTSGATSSVGVDVYEEDSGSVCFRALGAKAAAFDATGNDCVVVTGEVYGIRTGPRPNTASFKAPLVLTPSTVAGTPSHSADKGSLWVDSNGVLYINTNGSTTWGRVGSQ